MKVSLRRLLGKGVTNKILPATAVSLVLIVALWVPNAAARPGTPINLSAWAPNAWSAYFFFTNTATEPVGFEWEVTANNRPVPLNTLDCSLHKGLSPLGGARYGGTEAHPACEYAPVYQLQPYRALKEGYGRKLVTFSMNLTPETTYCFRVRAREWEGPNYGGFHLFGYQQWGAGMVSDLWAGWVCATTAPPPPPPASPSKPILTYFPAGTRAEGTQPDQLLIEWDGRLEAPDQDFRLQQLSYSPWGQPRGWNTCSNSEGYVSKLWQRTGPRSLYREVLTNVGEPSPTNPLTYRVCSVNRFGCSCSLSESVYKNPATATGPGIVKSGKFGPPFIQQVAPATYTKVMSQPPEYLQVQLTFDGAVPSRARYSIDDGLSMASACPATSGAKVQCWVDVAQLIVVGNTATVWIPYPAIQQTQQQVQIQLSNRYGASVGAVRVLPAYVQTPSAKMQNAPQKTLTAPSPTVAPKGFPK